MTGFFKGKENNYFDNRKKSRIFTPEVVSDRIFNILKEDAKKLMQYPKLKILDICCGEWALSKPFEALSNVKIVGIDLVKPRDTSNKEFIQGNYLEEDYSYIYPDLILCNPPFNNKTGGKLLLPFEFLKKILSEFPNTPLVLFTPHGLLNNNDIYGNKYKEKVDNAELLNDLPRYAWLQECITLLHSMLILPKDIFSLENRYIGIIKKKRKDKSTGEEIIIEEEKEKGILVHSFVTFWNYYGLQPFYTL
jgi:hypothetical protein